MCRLREDAFPLWGTCPGGNARSPATAPCAVWRLPGRGEREAFSEKVSLFSVRRAETREAAPFRRKRLPLYSHPETFSGQSLNTRTGRKKQVAYRISVSGKARLPGAGNTLFSVFFGGLAIEMRTAFLTAHVGPPAVSFTKRRGGRGFSNRGNRHEIYQDAGCRKRLCLYGCVAGAYP